MPARFENCKVIKDTGKALLIHIDDLNDDKWIPQSVIHEDSSVFDAEENSEGELVILDWFAIKEKLV